MSGIGKLTNPFFLGTNENTLALANINLDFSLVKLEAPKEFLGLGSTLSSFNLKTYKRRRWSYT